MEGVILEQGDIVALNFDPSCGHEPAKWHYAVVLSPWRINAMSSLVTMAPITSAGNGYPLHVEITKDNPIEGFVQCEALRAVDYRTRESKGKAKVIGALDDETLAKVLATALVVLGQA